MGLAERSTTVVDLAAAPVTQIVTQLEYRTLLAENPDKLVVIKWYAPWCRSCKAMDLKYKKLALERPEVIFCEVDVAASMELKKAHGVNVVPAIHMHAGHLGLVENFTCGPSKIPQLLRRINMYADLESYLLRARGGIMEKLSTFSAGVGSRLAIPSLPTAVSASSKGIMEMLAQAEEGVPRTRSLSDLSIMIG